MRPSIAIPSSGESDLRRERHGHQELCGVNQVELSPVSKVHRERGISHKQSMYCCRQGACEKLPLLDQPNSQKPMFRTQWQRFSTSLARLPARPEDPFAFNVAPGFIPASVPAIEGPPSLCHTVLMFPCQRRAVCASHYSAGETAFLRNFGLLICSQT